MIGIVTPTRNFDGSSVQTPSNTSGFVEGRSGFVLQRTFRLIKEVSFDASKDADSELGTRPVAMKYFKD